MEQNNILTKRYKFGVRNRNHNDSNCELSEEESNEVDSVRNRRARNRGSRDSNINVIKMQIHPFNGKMLKLI